MPPFVHAPHPTAYGTPKPKDSKVEVPKFSGKEVYPGLGCGFEDWCRKFRDKVRLAESASGLLWPEEVKISRLGDCLDGTALLHFDRFRGMWNQQFGPAITLDNVIGELAADYGTRVTEDEVMRLFRERKRNDRTWREHIVYLQYLNSLNSGNSDSMVLA